jgi:hypothetical protein
LPELPLAKESSPFHRFLREGQEAAFQGILSQDEGERERHLLRAEALARQARTLQPGNAGGAHLLATTLGLRIDQLGSREKIRLAGEIELLAREVLKEDPLHAGAHHVLGRLHAGCMRMNRVTRFLARKILGGASLEEASWEKAEEHLTLAEELEPEILVHHLELGLLYLSTDRQELALREMEHVLHRPALTPVDAFYRQRAQEIRSSLLAGQHPRNPTSRLTAADPAPPNHPGNGNGQVPSER